ncbi:hypothetical protein M422DRAFT_31738, partial [Sphaerobolus stellatus SS14]
MESNLHSLTAKGSRALNQLKGGHLRIASPDLNVEIRVKRPVFWTRMLLFKDMGLAEAYMYGDADCDDIPGFLRLFILNREEFKMDSYVTSIISPSGDIMTTRANISAHYDIGSTMFTAFLSKDLNYLSAIFKDFNEYLQLSSSIQLETLEEAQARKMLNVISKADFREGRHVLEIGAEGIAILAAQKTGCSVETHMLSSEQKELAEACITHHFDRFISVEMMEHVERDFFEEYWRCVDWALKECNAVRCVQVVTLPESSELKGYDEDVDFIHKWVSIIVYVPKQYIDDLLFPGGSLLSFNLLISSMTNGSKGHLTTDSNGNGDVIAPALRLQYNLLEEDLEIFRWKWLCNDYCEVGFVTRILGDHIISFTCENNVAL